MILSPRFYRRLAVLGIGLTVLVLLLPGAVVEAIADWVKQILPVLSEDSSGAAGHLDKLVHAVLFAVCGFLVASGWWQVGQPLWPLFLFLLGLGVLTELLQYPIPGRTASFWDVVADGAGALIGLWSKKGTDLFSGASRGK